VLDALVPSMPYGYREEVSPTTDAGATFVEVAAQAGIDFHRFVWSSGDLPYAAVIGGGLAAADLDHDGWTDLYFSPGGPGLSAKLYRNLGNWKFQDVTSESGLGVDGFGAGAVFGDYDNDGNADLYVIVDGNGHLYHNEGGLRFTDVSRAAGVSLEGMCGERPCQGSSVAWLDYDGDSKLDLYVVNNLDWHAPDLHTSGQDYASLIYFAQRQFSVLFHNNGDGTFSDVTDQAGVENTGKGLGAAIADVDGDGWPDIATANDITEDALYLNNHDGTFRNEARQRGTNEVKTTMGIQFADVNEDGLPDEVNTNFRGQKLSLLMQGRDGRFTYDTDSHGLGASWRGTGWGVQAFDYDLDGWLDIAHAVGRAVPLAPHLHDLNNIVFKDLIDDSQDELYRNLGHGMFAEATYRAGDFPGNSTTRALLAVDLDNDGDEDLVRVNLQGEPAEVLRNDRANDNGWLQLDLVGTRSNRDAFGAKVLVTLPDGRVLHRELTSAAGYQTGLGHILTIGLGRNAEGRVQVTWPSGVVEDSGQLAKDQRVTLTEGKGTAG
jgi:hypothetical protein